MTHQEAILAAFRSNGNRMTLGYILQHPWGYEFRARVTELRRKGYGIICELHKSPSENVYRLVEPVAFKEEPSGQLLCL